MSARLATAERPPDACIRWPETSYRLALKLYGQASALVVENLLYQSDGRLDDIVFCPHFKGQEPPPGGVVPEEWFEQRHWSVTVAIWYHDEAAKKLLQGLKLPKGARLEFAE